jgi:hypothetical protein
MFCNIALGLRAFFYPNFHFINILFLKFFKKQTNAPSVFLKNANFAALLIVLLPFFVLK